MRVENNRKNKPKSFLFLPPPPARDDITSNHRSSITLYLNTLLSTVSQIQIKQQEMRVNRQLEKRTMQGGLRGGGIGMQLAGKEMAEKSLENGKGKGRADPEVEKEKLWIIEQKEQASAAKAVEAARELKVVADRGAGLMVECGCCYGDFCFDELSRSFLVELISY